MDILADLLAPQRLIEVVDIGANPIDTAPPYRQMLVEGLCRVTGFEPQPQALTSLLESRGPNERYLPYAIGDGGAHELKICRASGMTSLLEPDPAKLDLFHYLKQWAQVLERVPVQTRRLDDVDEVEVLDFLKIDIQGGELAVFRGGTEKLARAVAIETEISFVTLYLDQPAFGEVDMELRSQGFVPHCFALTNDMPLKMWTIAPALVNNSPIIPLNQLLEADIVYIRDITRLDLLDDEQVKHLALIAQHCYSSYDLTLRCVVDLERRGTLDGGAHRRYLEAFPTVPAHGNLLRKLEMTLELAPPD